MSTESKLAAPLERQPEPARREELELQALGLGLGARQPRREALPVARQLASVEAEQAQPVCRKSATSPRG